MEPNSRPAAPLDLPAPSIEGGRGELGADPATAKSPANPGSGLSPYLPVPRHRRPSEAELAEEGPLANAKFIRFTIVFTLLFVMAMTAVIWYRWYPVALPSSSITFVGDPSFNGAVATLSRNGQRVYSVTIDKEDGYTATVWLAPAKYELLVTLDNRTIQRTSFVVAQMQGLVDNIAASATTTRPTTR